MRHKNTDTSATAAPDDRRNRERHAQQMLSLAAASWSVGAVILLAGLVIQGTVLFGASPTTLTPHARTGWLLFVVGLLCVQLGRMIRRRALRRIRRINADQVVSSLRCPFCGGSAVVRRPMHPNDEDAELRECRCLTCAQPFPTSPETWKAAPWPHPADRHQSLQDRWYLMYRRPMTAGQAVCTVSAALVGIASMCPVMGFLSSRGSGLAMLLFFPAFFGLLWAAWWLGYRIDPPKRTLTSLCAKCGYDLRGCTEPRCPECGLPFDESLLTGPSVDTTAVNEHDTD